MLIAVFKSSFHSVLKPMNLLKVYPFINAMYKWDYVIFMIKVNIATATIKNNS